MKTVMEFFKSHPALWEALSLIFTATLTAVVITLVLKLEHRATRRLDAMKNNINLRFYESIVRFIVIFLAAQWVIMSSPLTQPFGRVLFQGTTVIAAVAAFAAQAVIADLICGMMLSATKPFDIGDRIVLEDGTDGIVKDITLRHVTLQSIDTTVLVIPNSKLNGMKLSNMSSQSKKRSIHMRFHVSYDADVTVAMRVIGKAIEDSPYTVPGKPDGANVVYAPIYFIEYADSSLVMATTVYYGAETPTEVVQSDVNTRVKRALDGNGIEIPYNYVNVIERRPERGE